MNPSIWGPHAWFFLHTISFNYPIKPKECDKKRFKRFFMALKDVIPCKACRDNYNIHLREFPIKLDSREGLVKWLIDVHNSVNGKTNKKTYSYDEVIKEYENKLDKSQLLSLETDLDEHCNTGIYKLIKYSAIVILFAIILYIYLC